MRFSGKVAIVTGGGSGIGRATCHALSKEGAQVIVADINTANAKKTADEIKAAGGTAENADLDVTSLQSARAMTAAVYKKFGRMDILVNNAGWDKVEPFIESSEETWDKVIAINLKGPVNCTRAALEYMVERKAGKIINLGSEAGRQGATGEAVYSGAKGGVIAFTKAVAREMARYNINVNCVVPGLVETPLLDSIAAEHPKLIGAAAKTIPLGRIAKPEEIARVILFLASDDAGYITGQTLSVSGGLTMF